MNIPAASRRSSSPGAAPWLLAILALLVATVVASPALSSSSSSSSRGGGGGTETGRDSAYATMVVKCVVTRTESGRTLHLRPERTEENHVVEIDEKVMIRAQDKKAFGGRKKIGFEDLAVGQRVRVTVMPLDNRIVSLVVMKEKKAT